MANLTSPKRSTAVALGLRGCTKLQKGVFSFSLSSACGETVKNVLTKLATFYDSQHKSSWSQRNYAAYGNMGSIVRSIRSNSFAYTWDSVSFAPSFPHTPNISACQHWASKATGSDRSTNLRNGAPACLGCLLFWYITPVVRELHWLPVRSEIRKLLKF